MAPPARRCRINSSEFVRKHNPRKCLKIVLLFAASGLASSAGGREYFAGHVKSHPLGVWLLVGVSFVLALTFAFTLCKEFGWLGRPAVVEADRVFHYSYRKATMGSRWLARRAGRYPATHAASASAIVAIASVEGSCADRP